MTKFFLMPVVAVALGGAGVGGAVARPAIDHVIVIAMENTDAARASSFWHRPRYVYGNPKAGFINSVLIPRYAHATEFRDPLPLGVPSEPHYVWMEGGTNVFADHTFDTDREPEGENSTAATAHLVNQIEAAGLTWMTYQEDITEAAGACPVEESGNYTPRHNPFVFFRDISGDPPSKDAVRCAAHTRSYGAFAGDLAAGRLANYVFVTPNVCHDAHDRCGGKDPVEAGDQWLRAELPRMIDWVDAHAGVVFVVWDEGDLTDTLPFMAIGSGVKPGHAGKAVYDHGSLVRSVEEIFGLPILDAVTTKTGFADLFRPGAYP